MTNDSQKQLICQHLIAGNSITPIEALNIYGCFRLADVIYKLKNQYGYNIKTELIQNGRKRFAKYSLII